MDKPKYFVYIRGTNGPWPQLWYEDQTTGTGQYKNKGVGTEDSNLLYFRRLADEDVSLTFNELKTKYPCVDGFVKT